MCVLDLESLESKLWIDGFSNVEATADATVRLAIAGTGWNVEAKNLTTKKRTLRLDSTNAYEIITKALSKWDIEVHFNAKDKIIILSDAIGEDKGIYFTDELNLSTINIEGDSTDFATRLYVRGKDGLTFADINGGIDYIENFTYSDKVVSKLWVDERYEHKESMLEDARIKLEGVCKPIKSYELEIIDLASLSNDYDFLAYGIGDTVTLLSASNKIRESHRIIEMTRYPLEPERNKAVLSNGRLTFEELQQKNEEMADTVDSWANEDGTLNGSKVDGILTEQITDFEAKVAQITDLTVVNAKINDLEANKASIGQLSAVVADIGELRANTATIDQLKATNAQIENLKAENVTISGNLQASNAQIGLLESSVATIEKLYATKADIDELRVIDANIQNAMITKADIHDLNAAVADIGILNADLATIKHLVNGNLSSENIQAGGITSDRLTIANGFIKDAMIDSLNANKIVTGQINTAHVQVASASGNLVINDNTIQIRDANRVRVQIGKDASNDYSMSVWDSSGKLMFDARGLKADAIKDSIIRDDMVAPGANIDGSKLNISSVVSSINNSSSTLKASKVEFDGIAQTLEVAFNSLKTEVEGIEIGGRNLIIRSGELLNKYLDQNGNLTSNSTTNTMKDFISVKPKEVLTFQKENSSEYFRWNWYDKEKNFISRAPNRDNLFQWIVPEDAYYIWVSYPNTGNVKIERGTRATDFSPAPEDVDASINNVKEVVESNTTAINVAQGKINTLIQDTTIIRGDVTSLEDEYSRLEQTVSGLSSTIGKQQTVIDEQTGKINSTNSELSSLKQSVNGLSASVSSAQTKIETHETLINNKADLSIVNQKIDGIEIGGRNLLRNTNFKDKLNYWRLSGAENTVIVDSTNGNVVKNVVTTYAQGINQPPIIDLELNKNYTLSCFVKASVATKIALALNDSGNSSAVLFDVSTTWKKISATFTNNGNNTIPRIYSTESKSLTFYVANVMFEEGTKATTHKSAPEDTQQAIDAKANITDVYNKTEVYTKAQTDSQINIAKDAINLGVSQTYETKVNVESKATVTLNSAKSYADTKKQEAINSASTDATSKVNSAKNELSTEINKKANSVDVYKKSETYTKAETDSKIKVAKDSIDLSVSTLQTTVSNHTTQINNKADLSVVDEKINNIEIGGRNLIIRHNELVDKMIDPTGEVSSFAASSLMNDFISVNSGESLMFSQVYAKSASDNYFRYAFYGNDKTTVIKRSANNSTCFKEIVPAGAYWLRVSYWSPNQVKLERGTKATDWSPAPEDTQQAIDAKANITDVYNKNEVYTKAQTDSQIKVAKDSITQSVSSTYATKTDVTSQINNVNSTISNLTSRVSTAEQKITDTAITNIVKQNFYTKSETDTQITNKGYQTASQVQQVADALQLKFTQSGGYNLLRNSRPERDTSLWIADSTVSVVVNSHENCQKATGYGNRFKLSTTGTAATGVRSHRFSIKPNTKYTVSGWFYSESTTQGAILYFRTSNTLTETGDPTGSDHDNSTVIVQSVGQPSYKYFSMTITTGASAQSAFVKMVHRGSKTNGSNTVVLFNQLQVVEGEFALPWSPNPSEIYDGITTIDKDGIKVSTSKGAYTQFSADGMSSYDNNGNQTLGIRNGGLTFHANDNHEYIGYISQSAVTAHGINGISLGMTSLGEYISLGVSTRAADVNAGFSQEHYFAIASKDATSAKLKQGLNAFRNLYMNKWNIFDVATAYFNEEKSSAIWEAPNTYNLCAYGKNGVSLGYKDGDTNKGLIQLNKAVDDHDCRITLFSNLNLNGNRVKNGQFYYDKYDRSGGDYTGIFKSSTSSESQINVEVANDYAASFNIQTYNWKDYGKYIARFRYEAGTTSSSRGIDFYRMLNMNNYNITNVGNLNVYALQSEELEVNDIRVATPFSVMSRSGKKSSLSVTKSVDDITEANGTVTIVDKRAEVNLPEGLLFTEYFVQITANKLVKLAVTEKNDDYFVIETDSDEEVEVFYTIKAFQPTYVTRASTYGELRGEVGESTMTYAQSISQQTSIETSEFSQRESTGTKSFT